MASYSGTLTGGAVTTVSDSGFRRAIITNAYAEDADDHVDAAFHVTIDGSTPTSSTGLRVGPGQVLELDPLVYPGTTVKILCATSQAYAVSTIA